MMHPPLSINPNWLQELAVGSKAQAVGRSAPASDGAAMSRNEGHDGAAKPSAADTATRTAMLQPSPATRRQVRALKQL
jgi:hypothetical protein